MIFKDRTRQTGAEQTRLVLSAPQIAGSALAAITAAVAASYLGVTGTVIGAAVMSFAGTVATTIYTHYLKRTSDKVKHTMSARRGQPTAPDDFAPDDAAMGHAPADTSRPLIAPAQGRAQRWAKLGAAAALVFTISMSSILIYQVIVDQTVADQVTGKNRTNVERGKARVNKDRHAEPAVQTPSRSRAASPSPGPTAAATSSGPRTGPTPVFTTTPAPVFTTTPTPAQTGTPTPSKAPSPAQTSEMTDLPPGEQGLVDLIGPGLL